MIDIILPWFMLLVCTAVIALAGPVLVRSGEQIAQVTGMSRTWIGVILLATATSLPELVTGVSSVTLADAPNIAVADALGSCLFNLLMLVLLDELSRSEPLFRRIDNGHILTAGFGIILIGAVGGVIVLSSLGMDFQFLHLSIFSPFLAVIYLVAMRAGFDYQKRGNGPRPQSTPQSRQMLKKAIGHYCIAAFAVIGAGIGLPFIGLEIAETMDWQTTFVGTLFIAASTSVPELVVTISALRAKVVDMAIGGLLGSNLFDVLILVFDDALYTKGSLFTAISPAHAMTAFAAVIMSGIFIVALLFQPASHVRRILSWTSISLLMVYLLSAYASFFVGH